MQVPEETPNSDDTSADNRASTEMSNTVENANLHRYPTQDCQLSDRFGWYV